MNTQKMPRKKQLLVSTGLLMVSIGLLLIVIPPLVKELVQISDFFRGLFIGIGIVLEMGGIVQIMRAKKEETPV